MLKYCWQKVHLPEAGCDEAGRGCLAGPVFAAAVILPSAFDFKGLNDSKKLTENQRNILKAQIENEALAWAVAKIDPSEIDRINILEASVQAMHKALEKLPLPPKFILVDGNRFKPYKDIPHECIVKGDGKVASIAAASILAKTHRDGYMQSLSFSYPEYQWAQNKGYPTKAHREAIRKNGLTKHHRQTFKVKLND